MIAPYKNIAIAVTFSPTSKRLLTEAKRLKDLFNAKLTVIHIGVENPELKNKLADLLNSVGFKNEEVNLIIEFGKPADIIIKTCKEQQTDLLVMGALKQEKIVNYYFGSVARTIMRDSPCSVLFLNANEDYSNFSKICVSTDYSANSEITLRKAYQWALVEKLQEVTLIREIQVPGLAMTVNDSGSMDETAEIRKKWERDEIAKMDLFIKELNITGITYNYICLYGKTGWESKNYVNKSGADLFIISAPQKKLSFFDRLFPSGLEYIAKQLPCSLLLIKPENN